MFKICIALSDSVPGRDLPPLIQGKQVVVTEEQYHANTDILQFVQDVEPEKPKAKAKK
jgi:hypothetical protein